MSGTSKTDKARADFHAIADKRLEADPAFAADRDLDAEGIAIAAHRDREIESGLVKPLTDDEFRWRTSGIGKS